MKKKPLSASDWQGGPEDVTEVMTIRMKDIIKILR